MRKLMTLILGCMIFMAAATYGLAAAGRSSDAAVVALFILVQAIVLGIIVWFGGRRV